MMLSSITLALGAGADSALGVLTGVVGTLVAVLLLRHHKAVFRWMRDRRKADDNAKDLDDATLYLRQLFEKLCEYAQKPLRAPDVAPLCTLRNLIKGTAGKTEAIRTELLAVVAGFDAYLATALAPVGATSRVTLAEHTAQLETAMKQELVRIELERAVSAAEQRISALRKG
ncbi:hypothetical protein AB0D14_24065 [Streptomyces sp. NPDC048484]|uniref:hypothetical protein n=1 Tax=Streptomyces sp. NPDC048484 TaxID=3155146 RepID=UPI00341F85D7